VVIFACGRPLLSTTNGLAQVDETEQTASADRAKAVALVAAGYGAGAGVMSIVRSLTSGTLGLRGCSRSRWFRWPCYRSCEASVVGWSLAAGLLGAGTGLVAFGAVARAGQPFAVAGLLTFLPAIPVMGLFWLLPETRGREPEDVWPTRNETPGTRSIAPGGYVQPSWGRRTCRRVRASRSGWATVGK
jgi:hypothetical protein